MTTTQSPAVTFAQSKNQLSHTFTAELIKEAVNQATRVGYGRMLDRAELRSLLIDWSKQVISDWGSE